LIKHNVSKIYGNYGAILALSENGVCNENVLKKALELCKSKHPKKKSFMFIHCWLLLKDIHDGQKQKKRIKKLCP
jgi:hypothetical protein